MTRKIQLYALLSAAMPLLATQVQGADRIPTPICWTVERSRPANKDIPIKRGESVNIMPAFYDYGRPVDFSSAISIDLFYRGKDETNIYRLPGTATTNVGELFFPWTPACELTNSAYIYEVIVSGPTNTTIRQAGSITMLPNIGYHAPTNNPERIYLLDLAKTMIMNAGSGPWAMSNRVSNWGEISGDITNQVDLIAAISSHVGLNSRIVTTNYVVQCVGSATWSNGVGMLYDPADALIVALADPVSSWDYHIYAPNAQSVQDYILSNTGWSHSSRGDISDFGIGTCKVVLASAGIPGPSGDNSPVVISNLEVRTWAYPINVGKTNDQAGMTVLADDAQLPRGIVTLRQLSNAVAGIGFSAHEWSRYPAQCPVDLNGNPLILDPAYRAETSNGIFSLTYLGTPLLELIPGGSYAPKITSFLVSGTQVIMRVACGTATNVTVECSHDLVSWTNVTGISSTWPRLDAGQITITFPPTYSPAFYRVLQPGVTTHATATLHGDLLPGEDLTYDLGSSTRRWRELYLSGNTIHLGDGIKLSSDGVNAIVVDGRGTNIIGGQPIISFTNTVTADAGSEATVTNVGSPTNVILRLSIPRGDTGLTGPQGPAGVAVTNITVISTSVTVTNLTVQQGGTNVNLYVAVDDSKWPTNQPFAGVFVWTNSGDNSTLTNNGVITAIINTNSGSGGLSSMPATWDADEIGTNALYQKVGGQTISRVDSNGLTMLLGSLQLYEEDLNCNVRLYGGNRETPSLSFQGLTNEWGLYARGFNGNTIAGWSVGGTEVGLLWAGGIRLMSSNFTFYGSHEGDLSGCWGYPEPLFETWKTNMSFTYLTLSNLVVTPGGIQAKDVINTTRATMDASGFSYKDAGATTRVQIDQDVVVKDTLGRTKSKQHLYGFSTYDGASGMPLFQIGELQDDMLSCKWPSGAWCYTFSGIYGLQIWDPFQAVLRSKLAYNYLELLNGSSQTVFKVDSTAGTIVMRDTAVTNSGNLMFYGTNGTNLCTITGSSGAVKIRGVDSDTRYPLAPTAMTGFIMTNVVGTFTQRLWFTAQGVVTNHVP